MRFTLYQGTKYYSSWAMRPWVLMREAEIPFKDEEPVIQPFEHIGALEQLVLDNAITDKMPVLVDHQVQDNLLIWDTLAICDYLAEEFPEKQLWPADTAARAQARSICGQMHSGFVALRTHLPMNLCRDQALTDIPAEALADIQRICSLWADCRARFGSDGPFLFGHASIADAFYAPVASRLRSYRVELPDVAAAYVETIYQWPAFQRWLQAARQDMPT